MYDDEHYMRQALEHAQTAYEHDEVPIGAVVVSPKGVILGTGFNQTEERHAQSRHAEVMAIERTGEELKTWRLDRCTLYVTLEPCLMCMSLLCLSRIERLVYGARSPLFGYQLDKELLPGLYKKHVKGITSGVLEAESQYLLEKFFKEKRKTSE